MKKKLYVIQPIHFEYNDENYYEEGLEKAEYIFSDLSKAQDKLEELNKKGLTEFSYINEENRWSDPDEQDLVTEFYVLTEAEGDIDV